MESDKKKELANGLPNERKLAVWMINWGNEIDEIGFQPVNKSIQFALNSKFILFLARIDEFKLKTFSLIQKFRK